MCGICLDMASQLGHSKGNPDDRQKKSKDEIEIKKNLSTNYLSSPGLK